MLVKRHAWTRDPCMGHAWVQDSHGTMKQGHGIHLPFDGQLLEKG